MTKGTKGRQLTVRGISAMKVGEWAADPAARGAGRLQVRKLASGEVAFYYRYTAPDGSRDRMPLGTGLDLAGARALADELSRRYQSGQRNLREVIDAEQRDEQRQRDAQARAEEAAAERQQATLGALLDAYVAQLKRSGKASAKSVAAALKRHIKTAWPKLWKTPATEVTTSDLLEVVARLVNDTSNSATGKLREAAKLRSYLRAAFAAAIRAQQDARALPELRSLGIVTNPATDLATVEGNTQPGERALSVSELCAYWKRIASLEDSGGALLRFHLLTGGQRIEQLARLTRADIDADASCVRLRDPKGRRKVPRVHDVPLIEVAADALAAMKGGTLGEFVFTITHGASGASSSVIKRRLDPIVAAMMKADELPGGTFTASDLRRTVETRLAALRVSRDVRAQLQSHGLGGVQHRHYDRHDYVQEKRDALVLLHKLVTGEASKVVPLRPARKRAAS